MDRNARFYKYFVYAYSTDQCLWNFLRLMSKNEGYSENLWNSIDVKVVKSADPLSLEGFLTAIDFMNDYLNLSFICTSVLKYADLIKKRVYHEKYGVIIKEDFTKQNMSLEHRIDKLISLMKQEWE